MGDWKDKGSYGELTPEEKKDFWRAIRRELLEGWLILFAIQMVIGAYHLWQMWPEFADVPAWGIAVVWTLASAIMATILLPVVVLLMAVVGAIVFGIMYWRETRNER